MIAEFVTALRALRWRGRVRFSRGAVTHAAAHIVPGKVGRIDIGRETRIFRGAMLDTRNGLISIGERCSVQPYTLLYGSQAGLRIGNDVRIAAHCVIVPFNHVFDAPDLPIARQGVTAKGIVIEDDVWIGAHVTVLDGAIIRSGCVIGAGAVVRGDTEPGAVYAGVPARRIGSRSQH